MEVPLHEIANYPRFHEAVGAALRLSMAAIGDHGYLLTQQSDDSTLVLKSAGRAREFWQEGENLEEDSDLCAVIRAKGSQQLLVRRGTMTLDRHTCDGITVSTVVLADGRVFGDLVVLIGTDEPFEQSQIDLVNAATTIVGFAIDGELRVGRDRLTGLYTRPMFDDHLNVELFRSRRSGSWIAVIIASFDVPEEGLHIADAWWLARIAERLQTSVRQGDTIARVGAREVALIVPDLRDEAAARRVAQTIVDSMDDPFLTDGGPVHIVPAVGVSIAPVDGFNPDMLFDRAALALDASLDGGGGMFRFHGDLQRSADR